MNIKIEATPRQKGKKSDLKKYRQQGFIPAVIYGEGKTGQNILLDKIEFMKSYKKSIGEVAIFDVNLNGKKYSTFIKEKQVHPVSREMIHVDFVELHKGKAITIQVPFHYNGIAKGTHEGGALEVLHYDIELACLPKDIPDEINIDVSDLEIGDSIHLGDIELPVGTSTSMTDTTTLVSVRPPKKLEELEEETEEEILEGEAEAAEGEAEASEETAE